MTDETTEALGPVTNDAPTPAAKTRKRRGRPISELYGTAKRTGKKPGPKRGKYNAKGEHIDGIWFASQAEGKRYRQLLDMQAKGVIEDLELQVKYPVTVNNQHICNYLADFRYRVVDELGRTLRVVVEDVKGMMTDLYGLKRKLVEAQHHMTISEIPAGKIDQWSDRLP